MCRGEAAAAATTATTTPSSSSPTQGSSPRLWRGACSICDCGRTASAAVSCALRVLAGCAMP
eukprot:6657027-Alexandrium_andersonii.AAC.1